MNFLVDENLSPTLAQALREAGHDAIHVRAAGATGASDDAVMELADSQDRVIVSADTDFGALLASSRASRPSVILVREVVTLPAKDLAALVIGHLDVIEPHLATGAIVAFGRHAIRVRALPLR